MSAVCLRAFNFAGLSFSYSPKCVPEARTLGKYIYIALLFSISWPSPSRFFSPPQWYRLGFYFIFTEYSSLETHLVFLLTPLSHPCTLLVRIPPSTPLLLTPRLPAAITLYIERVPWHGPSQLQWCSRSFYIRFLCTDYFWFSFMFCNFCR